LKDNVILITGASSGIGAALAAEFGRRGAILVLAARRRERLDGLVKKLETDGTRALAVECDVTLDGDCEKAVEGAVTAFGRLDTVVANAGFGVAGSMARLTLEDYRRQFETNVFGVLRTIQAALPRLIETRGRIAVIGSVAGYLGSPKTSAYAMSKFAVRGLCASIGPELKRYGVSVTHIAPGFVESEIRAVDNQGQFHEGATDPMPSWLVVPAGRAARSIATAIAHRRRERVITGHGKAMVFLERHCPWLVAPLLGRAGGARRSERARS